jgi:hypothetical protein
MEVQAAKIPATAPTPTPAPKASPNLVEKGTEVLIPHWVGEEMQKVRRERLGLDDPTVLAFCKQCEFVSLGNYCGTAFALQALGLKRYAYPFDWVRSPAAGVIQCVQTDFKDFCSHSYAKDQKGYPIQMYGGSAWGGSFWHHRIQEDKCKEEFARRISRFYGSRAEVPTSMPRVFVRVLNSSQEIGASADLYHALQTALPHTKVYLLCILDLQKNHGLVHVNTTAGGSLLFYRTHESVFANREVNHTERMQLNGEAYAVAIADAVRLWSGKHGEIASLQRIATLRQLEDECQPVDGGCTSSAKYSPILIPRALATATPVQLQLGARAASAEAQFKKCRGPSRGGLVKHIRDGQQTRENLIPRRVSRGFEGFSPPSLETSMQFDADSTLDQFKNLGSYVSDVSTSASSEPYMANLQSPLWTPSLPRVTQAKVLDSDFRW